MTGSDEAPLRPDQIEHYLQIDRPDGCPADQYLQLNEYRRRMPATIRSLLSRIGPGGEAAVTERRGLYVASRTAHGAMWRAYRDEGFRINSTWIDECGHGETDDFSALWDRIESEVRESKALVLYALPSDFPLKGALVEVGMAMAAGVPIVVCAPEVEVEGRTMRPIGSWMRHKSVLRIDHLRDALYAAGNASMVPHYALKKPQAEA